MITKLKPGNYSFSLNRFVEREIRNKSKCLDVGCWTGNLGKILIQDKDCSVDGIDNDKEALNRARKNGYRNTYLVNLNADDLSLKNIPQNYDVIIFADILEHLIDPKYTLSIFKNKLNKRGQIIISLPNVAFILNRYLLLMGRWDYKEFGTLDKTHLRFFTINTISKTVESAGYRVIKLKPYNQFGWLRYLNSLLKLFPKLLAYQILIVAEPA